MYLTSSLPTSRTSEEPDPSVRGVGSLSFVLSVFQVPRDFERCTV